MQTPNPCLTEQDRPPPNDHVVYPLLRLVGAEETQTEHEFTETFKATLLVAVYEGVDE